MSLKAIAVAGLSAIAIAASGCSGDSDPEAEFRAAFEKKFSAAPWYHHITGMEMTTPGRIEVETKLDPASDSKSEGVPCRAIWHLAAELLEENGELSVVVIGSDGKELGGCA